jgi:hypothetical protein
VHKCSWEIGPAAFVARWKMRSHKNRRSWVRDSGARRVGLDQPPAVSRAHGQCRQSQRGQSHTSPSPRARAQRRTQSRDHKESPRPPKWFFWERIFHRATNAAGKSSRMTGSSYPARFPSCICSTMENAFPYLGVSKHARCTAS